MESWNYGEAAEPARFPWPPAQDGGILAAFGDTWRGATFDPAAFFRRMPEQASPAPAILYYLVLGILLAGVSLFWDVTGIFTAAAGDERVAQELGIGAVDPIVGFLLSPLVLLFGLALSAGVTHLILLLFGGARSGFGATVRVFCYAYSPMAFGIVPLLGTVVGMIWMVVLSIIGLREAHRIEQWKAVLAVLLPFFLFLGFLVFAMLVLFAAGAALLTG